MRLMLLGRTLYGQAESGSTSTTLSFPMVGSARVRARGTTRGEAQLTEMAALESSETNLQGRAVWARWWGVWFLSRMYGKVLPGARISSKAELDLLVLALPGCPCRCPPRSSCASAARWARHVHAVRLERGQALLDLRLDLCLVLGAPARSRHGLQKVSPLLDLRRGMQRAHSTRRHVPHGSPAPRPLPRRLPHLMHELVNELLLDVHRSPLPGLLRRRGRLQGGQLLLVLPQRSGAPVLHHLGDAQSNLRQALGGAGTRRCVHPTAHLFLQRRLPHLCERVLERFPVG